MLLLRHRCRRPHRRHVIPPAMVGTKTRGTITSGTIPSGTRPSQNICLMGSIPGGMRLTMLKPYRTISMCPCTQHTCRPGRRCRRRRRRRRAAMLAVPRPLMVVLAVPRPIMSVLAVPLPIMMVLTVPVHVTAFPICPTCPRSCSRPSRALRRRRPDWRSSAAWILRNGMQLTTSSNGR